MRLAYFPPDVALPTAWRYVRAENRQGFAALVPTSRDVREWVRREWRSALVPTALEGGFWQITPHGECFVGMIPWGDHSTFHPDHPLAHAARIALTEPIREDWRTLARRFAPSAAAGLVYDRWAPAWRDTGGEAAIDGGIAAFFHGRCLWVAVGAQHF